MHCIACIMGSSVCAHARVGCAISSCYAPPTAFRKRCRLRFDDNGVNDDVVTHFLVGCGSGAARPTEIVHTARALHAKHPGDPHYAFFASIGTRSGNNIERDLHRRCRNLFGCKLRPYNITLPLRDYDDPTKIVSTTVPTLAPYEVFAAMYDTSPSAFERCVLGNRKSPHSCKDFWDALASHTPHVVNTDLSLACAKDTIIPLYFHSDGGEALLGVCSCRRSLNRGFWHTDSPC
jgi:hypothetical protein